jgi:hypothetical protein
MSHLGDGSDKTRAFIRPADNLRNAVKDALRLLITNDGSHLESDVAERTICARLACYLEPHFPDHKADVEYNRHGIEPKRIALSQDCRGVGEKKIYPDVIVHQRLHDNKNLLVIQVKKETNRESRDCDRAIILAMKREFQYAHGLMIDLPAGPGATGRKVKLRWL